jgi:hypothetical protein
MAIASLAFYLRAIGAEARAQPVKAFDKGAA